MRLLFLGYSSVARRRIIPALAGVPEIHTISVASHSRAADITLPEAQRGAIFDNYEAALASQQADLVYVSTINRDHARWVERALSLGYHTIVDKPAFLSVATAERLLALARERGLCLAEANVYAYHPQIALIRQAFAEAGDEVLRITATFSVPPLPADDFRYLPIEGGGAVWDHGPYAASPGRIFFGGEPEALSGAIMGVREVESAFSVLAHYPGGRVLIGHFGFMTAYRNTLELLGRETIARVERAYTTPDDMATELLLIRKNQHERIQVPAASAFGQFIQAVVRAIHQGDYHHFAADLLSDARTVARLHETLVQKTHQEQR